MRLVSAGKSSSAAEGAGARPPDGLPGQGVGLLDGESLVQHQGRGCEGDGDADPIGNEVGRVVCEHDLLAKLASERERYGRLLPAALELCDPAVLEGGQARQVYVEGTAQFASSPELAQAKPLRELLEAIEEKTMLVALLNGCIETPEPLHIQIGVKEINSAGEHLSLITAPYLVRDQAQGSLGVLGPMRMEYERAITAVAYVARAFSEMLSRT